MIKTRYGFLFNHDAVHQVSHIAPIMQGLRAVDPDATIVAVVSSSAQVAAIENILGGTHDEDIEIKLVEPPKTLRWLFSFLNKIFPARRLYVLKKSRDFFSTLDCLIVPEMTSTLLKTRFNLKTTPLILFPHGAGDRSIGFGPQIKLFDYVLLSGYKTRDRMLNEQLIRADNHQVVGYPKFDAMNTRGLASKTFFENNNPTVLYNPHFDARLSSWYRFGHDILEFFAQRPHLNLIVAPHVMLFEKRFHFSPGSLAVRFRKSLPKKYLDCPNILIDTGSLSCVDMTYTNCADIYIGDASSQVYEFIVKQRPCIFLNSHAAEWKNDANYKHWNLGPVIDSLQSLDDMLSSEPVAFHDAFRKKQLQAVKETFDLTATPSSVRAAQAIVEYLKKNNPAVAGTPGAPDSLGEKRDSDILGILN